MRRTLFVLLAAALLHPRPSHAQRPADFSGVWEMDRTRSASALQGFPIGPVILTISQTDSEFKVETERKEKPKSAATVETLVYKLDGSDTTTGSAGSEIRTRARWEGSKLVTDTVRNVHGSTVTTHHVYALDPNAKELLIDKTLTVQHGYQFPGAQNSGSGQDVFLRRKAAQK